MAFNFKKYNVVGTPFRKCRELYDEDPNRIHRVLSLYINDGGKFDPSPVAVCEGYKINLPAHLTGSVEELLSNIEAVSAIKGGHLGIKLVEYTNEMGTFVGAEFENM